MASAIFLTRKYVLKKLKFRLKLQKVPAKNTQIPINSYWNCFSVHFFNMIFSVMHPIDLYFPLQKIRMRFIIFSSYFQDLREWQSKKWKDFRHQCLKLLTESLKVKMKPRPILKSLKESYCEKLNFAIITDLHFCLIKCQKTYDYRQPYSKCLTCYQDMMSYSFCVHTLKRN